jgi:hypothetical protein
MHGGATRVAAMSQSGVATTLFSLPLGQSGIAPMKSNQPSRSKVLIDAGAVQRRLHRVMLLLCGSLMLSGGASAQEISLNGGFDDALTGWELMPSGAASASTIDIDGDPASGSAQLTSNEAVANVRVTPLRQCVVLTEPGRYLVGASGRIDGPGGRLVAGYVLYRATDCQGGATAAGGQYLAVAGAWDRWSRTVQADEAPQSLLLQLSLEKTAAGGTFGGLIDDAYVVRTDHFFTHGFE